MVMLAHTCHAVALASACLAYVGKGHRDAFTTRRNQSRPYVPAKRTSSLNAFGELLLAYVRAGGLRMSRSDYRSGISTNVLQLRGGAPIMKSEISLPSTSYLNQERAIGVDVDLMSAEGGFSIDQLMELAGLSVASAVVREYPPQTHPKVLILCGPGNNGGDGLVAARHLYHFGYSSTVVYPNIEKVTQNNELYRRLTVQIAQLGIAIHSEWNSEVHPKIAESSDLIIDAIFGFSFKGWRGGGKDVPYDDIVSFLSSEGLSAPLVSVDIPSGWHVEDGPPDGMSLRPNMLVSLTAPKQCALSFKGEYHYLGGRFVPPDIAAKYNLTLPIFPGADQCVKLATVVT